MSTHNTNTDHADPFGPVIYSYTRAQAVADGGQIEVTRTAREAGDFNLPAVGNCLRAGVTVNDRAERLGVVGVVGAHSFNG